MSKTKIPLDFEKDGKTVTVILNIKEYGFYRILKEANGAIVLYKTFIEQLGVKDSYLKMIKKSVSEKLNGIAEIQMMSDVGYRLTYSKIQNLSVQPHEDYKPSK